MGNKFKKAKRPNYSKNNKKVTVEDFTLHQVIGRGNFGKVMLVQEKGTKDFYAMKVLKKNEIVKKQQVKHILAERDLLIQLNCPFIVDFFYGFQNDEKLYFIIEYVNGGEIYHHLNEERNFSEGRVKLYAACIIIALETIHNSNAIYRDLKPENLLIDTEGYIKLIDFGLAKILKKKKEKCKTMCGTPEYIAPEVLRGKKYSKEVDYWSLGTVLFEMLHGMPPFYSEETDEIYEKILEEEPNISKKLSSEAQDLLKGLLIKDPQKRLGSSSRNENIRNHPFFEGLDWDKVLNKKYKPEFIPKVEGQEDIRHIDTVFTNEIPKDSRVDKQYMISSVDNKKFEGWTFQVDSPMTKKKK
ncbi:non-specific serine/threonine protein kinase [Anaeramoeba flamelloides]|uniref:non-specific serine/threonine protein kinase n=1 Tax=Anaeramoeba flamelloides TaxID=1746091 RepID=A0AAV7YYZ7_9EUKA|nr:non-specific serine/threonine protein kinase [Anaeramoeba flamelloides]